MTPETVAEGPGTASPLAHAPSTEDVAPQERASGADDVAPQLLAAPRRRNTRRRKAA